MQKFVRLLKQFVTYWGFPGGSAVKNLPGHAEDTGDSSSVPESGRSPTGGNGHPLWILPQKSARKIFLPTKSHGQRGLVGYNPWGHKELDTTQWLSMQAHLISNFGLFSKSSKNKTCLSVLTSIIFCSNRNVLYIALFNTVLLATHSCLERETWLVFE